ncbi:HAD family hydrolase [Halocatena salina]|uniref:HAD family hydrolase n=1 Tax=Halocatena salina TaxID=2934340 RepID=A0A8U0A886_9EURY|nr:HAD-IA family hydrolase [Halocatena salina]UPM45046.1 HAD family hydrolase [Halocatena salina]
MCASTSTIDREYDAIVFDNDGVLIERTDRKRLVEAFHNSFNEFDVTPDDAFVRCCVHEGRVPTDEIRDRYGLDPEEWWPRHEAHATAVQQADIRTGRKALYSDVDAIRDLTHTLGLVSNNQHETIEFILNHHGLANRFETYYGREPTVVGANRKKPNPHYINRALNDLDTGTALYVGDSEKDVIAAERAGIDSAFLRREHRLDLTLSTEPTYEFSDLRSLVDELTSM